MDRGRPGPAVSARFRGHVKRNEIGPVYWTTCTVSECEPGKAFAFGVGAAGKRPLNVWRYEIAPADGGCDVTESFSLSPTFGLRLYWTLWGWIAGQGQPQGHAQDARADAGRGGEGTGGLGVEDRPGALLHLEQLGDATPEEAAARAHGLAGRTGVERVTWWENGAFERTDLPMATATAGRSSWWRRTSVTRCPARRLRSCRPTASAGTPARARAS